ncbi:DUF885 family protein [Pedobacter sp. V48]|uniref:DUF885 domain-containing protein n=1 Tax=Pedobacter sp. V48 TaxID=509635 RepID=UPI0003E44BAF|nr:DUF885 domain-containing protein [Pedobacter sp. V48]ETZ22142.1 hypothetical protein N824_24770 [Pedobacter sp. V48]
MKLVIQNRMLFASMLVFCLNHTSAQVNNKKLRKLFERYHQENLRFHPLDATFSGSHLYDDQLENDGSANYIAATASFNQKYLRLLSDFNRSKLNTADRISYDVMKELLEVDVEKRKLHLHYIPINQFSSVPLLFGQLGSGNSAQPFKTVQDYENWIKRIGDFRTWTDTAIANMKKGALIGMVLPKTLVLKMIPQMEELALNDPEKNIFFSPLKNIPNTFSPSEEQHVVKALKHAIASELLPAYDRMAGYLKNDYMQHASDVSGLSGIPGGLDIYNWYIRFYTTTRKTPEEIYQTGLAEVNRIQEKMTLIMTQVGFNGSLGAFYEYLKKDPKFMPFKSPEEVLSAYRNIYEKVKPNLPKLFSVYPKNRFEIKRVESFREASQNGPSYTLGSIDGSRPGTFYVPVPDATKINVTNLGLEATFIHEAIPGHHFQISLQQENTALPSFRRQISFSAFTEGWALYIESLGKQLGCYTDPYQEMGALNNEILRAIRLVVDVGIHTGKMSREQAIAYMLSNQSISQQDAVNAAERYMALPGQALSYKTGELEIQRIKEKLKVKLGKRFNIIRFHDALLSQGDMPLTVLDRYMEDWASGQ